MSEEIEIRLESLKTELDDKAGELNDTLNQMESEILENKTNKDLIETNIEDLQQKIDKRFKTSIELLKSKIIKI